MSYDFSTNSHGKWILAGEHAVVRGHAALVFPIPSFQLSLSYHKAACPLSIQAKGLHATLLPALSELIIDDAVKLLGQSTIMLKGKLYLENHIPLGAGMGGSAAFCVVIARWLAYLNWLEPQQIQNFARELEHRFHGKSSGLDIAGVSHEQGIYFKQGEQKTLTLNWQPYWYLSASGMKGNTAECINQVQRLWQINPKHAEQLDMQMIHAVEGCQNALIMPKEQGLTQLVEAIKQAEGCFAQWGLISGALLEHINELKDQGALAVKPTGSGGGGYVLSLWQAPLLDPRMIPAYSTN